MSRPFVVGLRIGDAAERERPQRGPRGQPGAERGHATDAPGQRRQLTKRPEGAREVPGGGWAPN